MKLLASLSLAAAGVVLAVPAAAQFAKPEDAIKYRQSAMFLQGQHFGRIAAMANGRAPFDPAAAAANADVLVMLTKLSAPAFGPGTEGGKSQPEIWKEQAKFKDLDNRLIAASEKLAVAAKGGDLDAIKKAVGAVGETCKSCHDAFRKK